MEKAKDNSKKKWLIIILIIILFVMAAAAGGFAGYKIFSKEKPKEYNGVVGKVYDDWDTGLEEEESKLQSKGIQIPGYATAEMKEGDMSLHLSIGNPETNECGFYVTLKLEDGTVLYESELLKPGYGLTDLPLLQTLETGEYTAIVYYKCVTLDEDETSLNSAESEFKLIVK